MAKMGGANMAAAIHEKITKEVKNGTITMAGPFTHAQCCKLRLSTVASTT